MSSQAKPPGATVQEFSIRVPKNSKRKHNVMRFNATLNVDFAKWTQVKMERENNAREYRGNEEEMPKFGAGSEFGRDAREEARRKKYGIASKKYKPEDQPWILKSGGKSGKKFKGTREGGISENAAYYVFTHAPDGAIEAFPLHEWYNFQPIQRYKALSAEEAEQEFSRRNKVMNYFSLMMRKRLKNDEEGVVEDAEAEAGKKGGKKEKELKISEMDDWMDSEDEEDDDDDDNEDDEEKKKKKKKKDSDDEDDPKSKSKQNDKNKKKKKKKKVSDDEAFEESDDGDEEGRECDYISDSTESESDKDMYKQIKGVSEEDALRKLLTSEEEEEDEEKDKKDSPDGNEENGDVKEKDEKEKSKDGHKSKDKKKKKKMTKKKDKKASNGKDSSSDFSSDSDSESELAKDKKPNSAQNSRSPSPAQANSSDAFKRKQTSSPDLSQSKKLKLDNFNLAPTASYPQGSSETGITEDAVRRYLMRKPMTTTELLQKFKSKKTGLTSEQLVNVMTQILKKINPTKQTIKSKMYLSIKS